MADNNYQRNTRSLDVRGGSNYIMDSNNTNGANSPSRPRSRTSPNIPRANINPVTIDSPVIKAVEILEKIKKGASYNE